MNTEALIDQLCLPQSYPHPVEVITTIETHISVVFLTGQYAYKLKKPVDFGFLNFTDLNDRAYFCQQELRLNRRTAPNLYLDVVPIYADANNQVSFSKPKQAAFQAPIDYLVKMNQFEPNWVLGRYLNEHQLSAEQEKRLAYQIAQLHLNANQVEKHSHLGEPETLLQPMLDNFPTLTKYCSEAYQPRLQALLDWTYQQFETLKPLLVQRKQQGFVRECHGDLHLDNITLLDDIPTLFDGIEFNDEFRWIDGISDLAFLLIDLDFRGRPGFGRRILSQYLMETGDYDSLQLLSFYRVYRSLVRAKISALRLQQLTAGSPEHQHYKSITIQYIEQAEKDAFGDSTPKIILLQGISGSGKSHFSKQLLQDSNAVIISSDIERKRLFGIQATERVSEQQKAELYSSKMSQQTYLRLQQLSEKLIQFGYSVIVDATLLKREQRQPFYEMAQNHLVPCKLIYLQTDLATATQSIKQRALRNDDPSDADISVMQKQLQFIEAPDDSEPALCLNASELRKFYPQTLVKDFLS